jgi:hypothetical protein
VSPDNEDAVPAIAQYSAEELARIRSAVAAGDPPMCPICNVKMSHRDIGGGSFGLGYARKRDWLICGKCKRARFRHRAGDAELVIPTVA